MPSDIEIAQAATLKRIAQVAKEKLGIADEHLEPFGHYKAKVSLEYLDSLPPRPNAKLILVTAMTPTPAGEGKTTRYGHERPCVARHGGLHGRTG